MVRVALDVDVAGELPDGYAEFEQYSDCYDEYA